MGSNMSLASKDFSTTAKAWGVALLSTMFMAANANAAEALTCYTRDADIEAAKTRILQNEGMIPVVSHFKNVGTNEKAAWAMATLMYNPQTKKGYEWAKLPAGAVCVSKSYSNIQLYANLNLNPKAFLDKASAPQANDTGNNTGISNVGVNAMLLVSEKSNQYPMYRASVDDIVNVTGTPLKTPSKYIEFLVGNPTTKEGTILAANHNGKMISEYFGIVGTPAKDGVRFGAIYSPAGEDLVGLKSSAIAMAPTQR